MGTAKANVYGLPPVGQLLSNAVGAALLWLKAMQQLSTVYDSMMGVVWTLLRYPIGSERIHFTLGNAIGLVVILVGGYAVANALTFLLKNVVRHGARLCPWLPTHGVHNQTVAIVYQQISAVAQLGLLARGFCAPVALLDRSSFVRRLLCPFSRMTQDLCVRSCANPTIARCTDLYRSPSSVC